MKIIIIIIIIIKIYCHINLSFDTRSTDYGMKRDIRHLSLVGRTGIEKYSSVRHLLSRDTNYLFSTLHKNKMSGRIGISSSDPPPIMI
jgi:hypothetical protein